MEDLIPTVVDWTDTVISGTTYIIHVESPNMTQLACILIEWRFSPYHYLPMEQGAQGEHSLLTFVVGAVN